MSPAFASPVPEGDRIVSVGDLTRRIKELLETELPELWVRGEVSNLRRQSSGHLYFTLKDAESQVPAVLFRGDALRQSVELADGMQVVAFGRISVFEPRGAYQLIARWVLPAGLGRLQQEFERLKQKLAAEGLFDAERKRALPLRPRTVGFITSPTGAAIRDFISILRRRDWRGRLVVLPARVQGREAAGEIVARLEQAQRLGIFDLLVVGRGGGSLEDLWPFNEEAVVRAVAACTVPVISAVGHEIDFTLCDFAADRRAETPSAAAELISSGFLDCCGRLERLVETLEGLVEDRLQQERQRLELLSRRLAAVAPARVVEHWGLRLDDLEGRMDGAWSDRRHAWREALHRAAAALREADPRGRLDVARLRLEHLKARLEAAGLGFVRKRQERLTAAAAALRRADVHETLRRGFVLALDEQETPLTRRAQVKPGQALRLRFFDGDLDAKADERPPA